MNKTIQSQNEFYEPTKQLYIVQNPVIEKLAPEGFTDFERFSAKFEKELGSAEVSAARKRLAKTISDTDGNTIRSIRLERGWSQTQLAERMDTSQPHIARIEKGREDLRLSTARKLSEALNLSMDETNAALKATEEAALGE